MKLNEEEVMWEQEVEGKNNTSNAIMVGATGDGAGKEGRRIGARVEVEVSDRDADADGGGGTTVQSQNDVAGSIGRWQPLMLALEAPNISIDVPILHLRCFPTDRDGNNSKREKLVMLFNSILPFYTTTFDFFFFIYIIPILFIYP